jgi:hypothetical protein
VGEIETILVYHIYKLTGQSSIKAKSAKQNGQDEWCAGGRLAFLAKPGITHAALAWSRSVSLLQYQVCKHVEHLARRSVWAVKIACFKYVICKMTLFTESIL